MGYVFMQNCSMILKDSSLNNIKILLDSRKGIYSYYDKPKYTRQITVLPVKSTAKFYCNPARNNWLREEELIR